MGHSNLQCIAAHGTRQIASIEITNKVGLYERKAQMKVFKILILIVQFCFISPLIATAQSIALPALKSNVTAANEPKSGDTRIKDMEQRMLDMENLIRKLSAEVEQLRAERDKAGTSALTATNSPQPVPLDSSVSTNPVSDTSAAPKPDQDPKSKSTIVESVLPGVKLSGNVLLYAYSPIRLEGAKPSFDLYSAGVNLDREGEDLGFHIEFRFRSTKFRPFFDGSSWVQEAYVKSKVPGGTIKIGRIYKQLGIFSDYSFYGDLPYFDGLKYNPEWGASYEGENQLNKRLSFQHAVQFFRSDSRNNGSLLGRDVVSDPNSRRQNEVVLRGVPKLKLSEKASIAIGGTFERGQVSRQLEVNNNTYRRSAAEATLTIGSATLFSEVIRQKFDGTRFADLPNVTYTAVGGNYDFKKFSVHVNYSQGNYDSPGRRKEYIIQPGFVVPLGKGFSLYNEYNYWVTDGGRKAIFDRSMNTVLIFSF
jgi:hypothetical protein